MSIVYSVPNKGYIVKETNVKGIIGNYFTLFDSEDTIIESSIVLSYLIKKLDNI